ncbi:MAG: polysaccharide deacetylase family protein [Actinomycetota bacterium]|nr:polysaccharide deacetylase family protein [Actinomycetota bacterium]
MNAAGLRAKSIAVIVCLAFAAAGCGGRATVRLRPKAPAKAAAGKKKALPATLTISVVDASTSEPLTNVPVAAGKRYLSTGAAGMAVPGNLTAGDITITARAPQHSIYRQSRHLQAGDNTVTIALSPESETPDSEPVVFRHKAYLTIDDGPSATWTPEVLDILKREGVPATFFVVGWRAAERPDLVRRAYLEGNAIGNHTYSHDYGQLYRGSPRNLTASFARNGLLLKNIIGYAPTVTRPPGGAAGNFRPGWQSRVTGAGYTTVLWNVTTGDGSTRTTSSQMVENAKTYLARLKSPEPAVILMHDIRPPIVKALPKIIAEVRRRGYEFSSVTDDLREPGVIIGPRRKLLPGRF